MEEEKEPQTPQTGMSAPPTEPALLDLSATERIIRLRQGEHVYHHYFSPLTHADWERYYAGFQSQLITTKQHRTVEAKRDECGAALWDAKIQKVQGYIGAENIGPADLPRRMPLAHKLAAVELLAEVVQRNDEPEAVNLMAEEVPVFLSANWNLERYNHLVHYFRAPSQQDELEWRRAWARSFELRGSRSKGQRFLFPSKFGVLIKLYDRLILRVEGYLPSEASAKEGAIKLMDPIHKLVAANLLFGQGPEAEAEEEEEGALDAAA